MPSSLNHPNSRFRSKGKKTHKTILLKSLVCMSVPARKSCGGDSMGSFSYNYLELQMDFYFE